VNLLGLTYDQLVSVFKERYHKGGFHAAALYRAFYGGPRPDLMTLPPFQASPELARRVHLDLLKSDLPWVVKTVEDENVFKSVVRLSDGLQVEMVVIPMANHTTVCVSCQAGCAMGCRFCQTGRWGLRRNLTAAEIVSQIYLAKVHMGLNVRNVVFMGMGEPLDNFDEVVQAIQVISDQRGLNIAKRHITVSTCGLVDGIKRLGGLNWPDLKLAISLNAANDRLRTTLMPINSRYPLGALKSALQGYPLAKTGAIFIEYVLIRGMNDSDRDVAQISDFLIDLPAKLNLIPYNSLQGVSFEPPSPEEVSRFRQKLIDKHIFVRLRRSKGASISAACGQLGANWRIGGSITPVAQ
jgi:23S rRNA (adenine2503-C2)-methyltransferase